MADNNGLGAPTEETSERVHAPKQQNRSKVGVNAEAYGDEINQNLSGINTKVELMSWGGVGNATAGDNQQPNGASLAEELAPRTTTNESSASFAPGSSLSEAAALSAAASPGSSLSEAAASGSSAPPKQGVDDTFEKPEGDGKVEADVTSSGTASGSTGSQGDPTGDAAAAKSDATIADNAKKQGASMAAPGGSNEKPPENKMAANSSIVSQIMGEYQKVKSQSTDSDNGTTLKGTQPKDGEKAVKEEQERLRKKNNETKPPDESNTDGSTGGGATPDTTTTDENGVTTGTQDSGSGSKDPATEVAEAEKALRQAEADNVFNGDLTDEEKQQRDKEEAQLAANKAQKQAASKEGVDVGRSVGYGAIVEDNGKKITPFGPDEESINAALPKFRDDHTKAAQAKGDTYYTAYAHAYNEGMEQGIKLKKEADAAARNQQLADEKKTIEYKVGGILGTACGAAAAKRESAIDVSYEIPVKDAQPEKVVIQGPLNPVRSAIMGQKKTPDGKLEGEALERSFMQSYNMAQEAHSKQKKKGPERDADYTAGYDRGYKLGKQIAEGTEQDPALLEEKKSYNTLPEDAPKPKQQNKNGFYAGYNRGQIDVENKKAKAKKDAVEERNNDPSFKSGFATGSMQGFLKALLDPSGTDLLKALENPEVMKEGGVPEFFPIPDVIRANVIAVIQGGSGDKAVNELINKPKFKEGQLIGFNQGYGNGEQNRMTFKQQQFRLHPDYQESQKIVYSEADPISGDTVGMNMGHLEAHLQADYRALQKQENLSTEEETQLKTYDKTLKALAAETAKQNEFYRRGVIDSYNSALPVEEKRVKDAVVKEAHNDPEYLEGFHWGEAVGESLFAGKEKVKELRRNGVDITARNQALNKKRQQVNKDAQKKGKKYFDGYARGYSDMLRNLENAGKKTDMGNDLTNTDAAIKKANRDKLDPAVAKKAFEEGAKQGYDLYFENAKINVETGEMNAQKDYDKLKDNHNKSKTKSYQKDFEAKKSKIPADQLIPVYQAGYNFIEYKSDYLESSKKYGAGKGLVDANQFNTGFKKAVEDAKNGETKEPDGKDAYKAGYYAGEKYAKYTQFRSNMIGAQSQMQNAQTNADGSRHSTNVDHTNHAATENSVADTNALGVLGDQMAAKEAEKITHAANPVEMTKQQEGKLYEVHVAEHGSQARDLAENRKWLTKVIYLKEGISLKGTELENTTVSVELKDESGNTVTKTISNKPEDVTVARDFYGNRARYIEQLAQAYVDKTIAEDKVLSSEGASAKLVKIRFPKRLEVYEAKLQQIKGAYIKGYNELFNAIITQGKPDVFKAWYRDVGYIEGIKEQAGDNEEVKKLHLPSPPSEDTKIDKESDEYQNGYIEGIQMGQQIQSGLVDLKDDRDAFAKMQGGDYKRGFDEGIKIGVRTGEVAAREMDKKPPSEQDIKDNLAEQRKEAGLEVDPEFERGYVEGFFIDYWKTRDYYYGIELGYEQNQNGAEGSMTPEDGVTIKDNAAFIDGYNKGRSNAQMGRDKNATGKEGEEENTFDAKVKKAALDIAWYNGTIKAMTEINNASPRLRFLDKLPLVFAGHPLYGQFESLKSIQAITTELGEGSLDKGIANTFPYEIPEPLKMDSNEDLLTIDAVNSMLPSRDNSGMGGLELDRESIIYLEIIKDTYKLHEENTYQQALSDMMNLTMIMASDPTGGGPDSATTGGGSSTGDNAGVVADLMEELDRLFGNGGSHQNFVIDELELIDRFYDLESEIEGRHDPIKDKLEQIDLYQMTMEYVYDADTTLLASEIYQLELDIQALDTQIQQANAQEKKALRQEKRELENELQNKQREERLQGTEKDKLQRDWEQAEEDVRDEIDQIRLFMEDEIAFETPLASNEDILEYIKINLETSKRREEGEQIYEDINIFNNLKLQGGFDYEETSAFDAYLRGDGTLQISADAERINVGNADVEIEREGFKFTAKGLEHDHNDNSFTLFDGHLITPKIEGGRHEGVKLDYTFHTFRLEKGFTIKAEIENQIDQLKGG
ncbi:MAG: hypothetical protein AB8E82_14245 [Aureispira sp.]